VPEQTALALATAVASGARSALDITRDALARIEDAAALNAFITVDADRALARAADLDRRSAAGESLGALAGVPLAVKDNIAVRGMRTTAGSRILDAYVPPFDATGFMSRELSAHGGVDRHFPMQGSMGFAPAIALGIARTARDRAVHVLDGDGALIMRMGTLATIGAYAPERLVHFVVDNGTYASTGGQLTVSPRIDFARIALACGYVAAATCRGRDALGDAMAFAAATGGSGPVLVHIAVDEREAGDLDRPELSPAEIATAFRRAQGGQP